ncbi:MAG: hypothetical protein EOM83_14290 [Clostridia bacterium]|nr:hypothetical protein [Clostridia bacterium]
MKRKFQITINQAPNNKNQVPKINKQIPNKSQRGKNQKKTKLFRSL